MNVKREFKTVKERVLYLLEEFPTTRNSDKLLIIRYLKVVGFDVRVKQQKGEYEERTVVIEFPVRELGSLPNFETIRRVRAEIQNKDGLFPPTNGLVRKRRMQRQSGIYERYRRKV